jgi:hypothetical protein
MGRWPVLAFAANAPCHYANPSLGFSDLTLNLPHRQSSRFVVLPSWQHPRNEMTPPRSTPMADITITQETWIQDVTSSNEAPTDWLWHGFVARRNLTRIDVGCFQVMSPGQCHFAECSVEPPALDETARGRTIHIKHARNDRQRHHETALIGEIGDPRIEWEPVDEEPHGRGSGSCRS